MKHNIVLLYKNLGETPLETITRYKGAYQLEKEKVSFAGRLDPMAEGLLLVLLGEENKKRKTYEDLEKTYVFSFISGFATDTYDLLGKVVKQTSKPRDISEMRIAFEKAIAVLPGKKILSYPPYSSYHINGKPLYYLARKGELPPKLPTKEVVISNAEVLDQTTITKDMLQREITQRIGLVKGNFRQEEILSLWDEVLSQTEQSTFLLTHAKIVCSSGTYVRQIVQSLGEQVGIPTVTYTIKRTNIGPYGISDIVWFS